LQNNSSFQNCQLVIRDKVTVVRSTCRSDWSIQDVSWFICGGHWYIFGIGQIQLYSRTYPEVKEKSRRYWSQTTFFHGKSY